MHLNTEETFEIDYSIISKFDFPFELLSIQTNIIQENPDSSRELIYKHLDESPNKVRVYDTEWEYFRKVILKNHIYSLTNQENNAVLLPQFRLEVEINFKMNQNKETQTLTYLFQ